MPGDYIPLTGSQIPQPEITVPGGGDDLPQPDLPPDVPEHVDSKRHDQVPEAEEDLKGVDSRATDNVEPWQPVAQSGSDELFLSGVLQVDAAISALELTGVNPQAVRTLRAVRNLHGIATTADAKNDLTVFLEGDQAAAMKADIIAGALLVEQNQALSPETRIAARGLLDVFEIGK